MLAVLIFILVGCIVGPFINYDLYLTAFLFLTGGSLLQLLLFAIASIRTTRESLQVLGVHCDGGMRQRMVLPAHKLHPCNALDFDQLALVETLAIGCHAVNRSGLTATEDVLIVGAGPIGLTVLEFARLVTSQITVLELNPKRRHFVETHYPGTKVVDQLPADPQAQVVFDATGNAQCMAQAFQYARFTGRIVFVGITKEPVPLDDPLFHRRELTLIASRNAQSSDFPRILDLIATGRIDTNPWISHRADFSQLPSAMADWIEPDSGVIKAVAIR